MISEGIDPKKMFQPAPRLQKPAPMREDNKFSLPIFIPQRTLMAADDSSETPKASKISPARGKLGIMIPGMGAVATTFMAGVEAVRNGIAQPIGSLTQMGTIRLGKRTEGRSPKISK